MFVRLLGIGLLVAIAVPLIIAFPPLALVAVGGGAVWLLRRRGPGAPRRGRPRRTGARFRDRAARRQQPRRSRPRARRGTSVRWLMFATGVAWLAWTAGNQPAAALGWPGTTGRNAVILLAAVGLVLLVWFRALRRPGQRRALAAGTRLGAAASPGTTVQSGTDFEWQVVDLLSALGYCHVQHVGGPGDGGVDILAEDDRGRRHLVQCKRFAPGKKVGSVEIQKLIGAVVHLGADGGIFVTTASFTGAAIDLATTGRVPITLYDGRDVARLSRAVT